jgi:hypothetical protein
VFVPERSGTIIPSIERFQRTGGRTAAAGGGTSRLEIAAARNSGDTLMDEIIKRLRYRIRTQAGGNPTTFFQARSA